MIVKCKNCNKKFNSSPSRLKIGKGQFCSIKCHGLYVKSKRICKQCNKEFLYLDSQMGGNFCCSECYKDFLKIKYIIVKCWNCDKEWKRLKTRIEDKRGRYCNKKCYYESMKMPIEIFKRNRYEYNKRYRKENHAKYLSWKHKRRALVKELGGVFADYQWENLLKECNYECINCEKKKKLTVDHIISIPKWLKLEIKPDYKWNDIENIQPLCGSCNSKKSYI